MPTLPFKLISLVIASVEYRPTILTLCLVSRAKKDLAEVELLRDVTIDHHAQPSDILPTLSTYLLSPQNDHRRLHVKSLKIVNNPDGLDSHADDFAVLDSLIPQLTNLHTLFLDFVVLPYPSILGFLQKPLPTVQLKHRGLKISVYAISTNRHVKDGIEPSRDAGGHYALDISKFMQSQPSLECLEYLEVNYIHIDDNSIPFPHLRSYAGPLSFFNTKHRSPTMLSHLRISCHCSIHEIAAIPDLPSLTSLSCPFNNITVFNAVVAKTPNLTCFDAGVNLSSDASTRLSALRLLRKLKHIRLSPRRWTSDMADEDFFGLPECPESLQVIEVYGLGTGVSSQRFVRGTLECATRTAPTLPGVDGLGQCTECINFRWKGI
ncbi:hypothetical protein ONZ45_g17173 [Pleurotus djamor]|nr:hypothetical protein ONZ45_g17173 [Pleurotus djamor]